MSELSWEFVGKDVAVSGVQDPVIDAALDSINFDVLTPTDQVALFRSCRMRGIDISAAPKIQRSILRFSSDFWARSGVTEKKNYLSSSTRTLVSVWSTFYQWCTEQQIFPILPAKEETIHAYFSYRADAGISKNTLKLDAWAISKLHAESGCIDPIKEPRTKDFLVQLRKKKVIVEQDITRQASGLRGEVVKQVIAEWGNEESSLKQKRDLAIVVVGYFTLLRASEMAQIRLSHISIEADGGGTIVIPVSKTNHSGVPDVVYLSSKQMAHVVNYLDADGRSQDEDGFLFGMVSANGKRSMKSRKSLDVQTIRTVMGVAWESFGKDLGVKRKFTAHSTRVGGSQDMRKKKIPLLDIMHAGRWSSIEMVSRYTRDEAAKQSAAISLQDDF
ncbi:Phage integrase family protein [compost metagenome]